MKNIIVVTNYDLKSIGRELVHAISGIGLEGLGVKSLQVVRECGGLVFFYETIKNGSIRLRNRRSMI